MKFGKLTPQSSGNVKADVWVKAYETTLTEAATSVTISNLLGNTDVEYKLEVKLVSGYSGICYCNMRINNDSGANYGYQEFYGGSIYVRAERNTADSSIHLTLGKALGDIGQSEVKLYAKSGFVRTAMVNYNRAIDDTLVDLIAMRGCFWNNTVDEITSIVIYANQTDGLGIGTSIILWKKVAR